ncbi:FAD-binding and (Fe-S)-binding domain-containing protein [Prevotella sp. tf2-5]|uniref:FAD-binding and (Fe-S)-binding domain-containing protein n=1 Tax=Prevotella sp. tf2-5 TaxID=1761889 RepID=UPI0008EF8804|nr:FAD-binding and (Fe-S)-binding domain-containing protein [Prevotella sp. tf2-5]SFP07996.1 D-lactate dehydrogenase [Prevotella sp. tf2-5]
MIQKFLADLRQFIPSERIYTDELRTLGWGTDASFYRQIPKVVIRSDGEEEISKIVKACKKYNLPFTFRAAGTSLSGQSCTNSVLIVAGKHWEKYEIGENQDTIRLQPGIVGAKVNEILKPYGRVFPPDPASIGSAMVGGIVINNASGMNCGVHANSDRMMISARIILTDGTVLDTGSEESREAFRKSHPEFLAKIEVLRDKVRADKELSERISKKYSIKNVTGLNLRPLIAYDDPFDIIAHSMVGSEGTLAFLSEVTMKTLHDYQFKASAMVYFLTMKESCEAVVAMKKLKAGDDDLKMSAENLMVKSAEMLDYKSLSSVDDPVYLQYQKDVDAGKIDGVQPGDYHNLTAILTETKGITHEQLLEKIAKIKECLGQFRLYIPAEFTEDPAVYGKYWAIRSGIFPSVGGTRPIGTSCLIEDVAFPIESLPEATVKLQKLIADHGYDDACIYGHAFEGNYHFILNQSFADEHEVARYAEMMRDVAKLVVEEYDGSLKAEHGTGRNMAPFVKYEWGEKAFEVMKELKAIFDPEGLLNQGVIFNDDPDCFIKCLKPLPVLDYDFDSVPDGGKYLMDPSLSTAKETVEQVKRANKCIECGFCEVNCMSCGLTLSSRMRIAVQREIRHLTATGENPERLATLKKQYKYYGDQTCATDGLCSTSCPMKINTGELTHLIRQLDMNNNPTGYKIGEFAANHMAGIKSGLRVVLDMAHLGHVTLGSTLMTNICRGMNKMGLPLWTTAMPKKKRQPKPSDLTQFIIERSLTPNPSPKGEGRLKVVYFPSCINQTMGQSKNGGKKHDLVDEIIQLMTKAGYEVIFPEGMEKMCCGQIWESKGMLDIADRKSAELEAALWKASEEGKYPVLCAQSPCLHRMKKVMHKMKLYEPAEFIMTYLVDRLDFHPVDRHVALHLTCSTRQMGVDKDMIALAKLCSKNVFLPEGVGCCGFAGDRGFTFPELNKYGLRKLRPQIEENHIEVGYSNSRTCEIGLETNTGIPYMSIVYLVNECTTAKK